MENVAAIVMDQKLRVTAGSLAGITPLGRCVIAATGRAFPPQFASASDTAAVSHGRGAVRRIRRLSNRHIEPRLRSPARSMRGRTSCTK